MAVLTKEKYNQSKLDKLADYLRLYKEKGQPIDYEIMVDGFKAVRRTNDPEMFSMFENFVNADTKSVEVLFYTGTSNNNDKHIYFFGDNNPKEELSGLDIDSRVEEQMARKMKDSAYEDLKKKNIELEKEVSDLEDEIERLEKDKAAYESSQSPLKGILGDIGSSLVESFIRRNPAVMKSIPGGDALAGLIDSDDKRTDKSQAEGSVSFQPKQPQLSEEDNWAIAFGSQLKSQFKQDEFNDVLEILQALSGDKSKIKTVLQLLTN